MKKSISQNETAQIIEKLKYEKQSIILVGGCFDVLHEGHIKFLNKSKAYANKLILLLESDENIKKIKGERRPLNNQKIRSLVLSSLPSVDYIILLKGMTKSEDYDKLIAQIKPEFIALTKGDKNTKQRRKQCEKINAKLIQIKKFGEFSSTGYINNIY